MWCFEAKNMGARLHVEAVFFLTENCRDKSA